MDKSKLSDISLRQLTVRHVKAGYPSVYHYAIALEGELEAMEKEKNYWWILACKRFAQLTEIIEVDAIGKKIEIDEPSQ